MSKAHASARIAPPEQLQLALVQLLARRLQDGGYLDEGDSRRRAYFSTLEGLECFLIPLVSLDWKSFGAQLISDQPALLPTLIDDVSFVLQENPPTAQPPNSHGQPYFRQPGPSKQAYWTSECASFTLSALTNYLTLSRRLRLPSEPSTSEILRVIRQNVTWLTPCKRNDSGWAWLPEAPSPHPWPTWSILDTLEEMRRLEVTKPLIAHLNAKRVAEKIHAELLSTDAGTQGALWEQNVAERSRDFDVVIALDMLRLMLACSLHVSVREIQDLTVRLYSWAHHAAWSNIDYVYHLAERQDHVADSSLVPSVLRALLVMASSLGPKYVARAEQQLGFVLKQVIDQPLALLGGARIQRGPFLNLWGVEQDGELRYELYFTERTIEALTEYCLFTGAKIRLKQPPLRPAPAVKVVGHDQLPIDTEKMTMWIRDLARGIVPSDLQPWELSAAELFEFYLYRVFTVLLGFQGNEEGRAERGTAVADATLLLPEHNTLVLYDAKARSDKYSMTRDEQRACLEYIEAAKLAAKAASKELRYFVIISSAFGSFSKDRVREFDKVGCKLVAMQAKHLSEFVDKVRSRRVSPNAMRLIDWNDLLARARPELEPVDYEEVWDRWDSALRKLGDLLI